MNITARYNNTLRKNRTFKILVCLITLITFSFNTVCFNATLAVGTPSELPGNNPDKTDSSDLFKELHVDTFTLPEYLGHIKDSYNVENSDKVIIHIQDAHCNYAAQRKIADIIEYLTKKYGIDTINLEGGAKDYDLSSFTSIYDKRIREKVADYFVKEGLVNGPEYFAINNPEKVPLWGIEDTKLYLDNLNVYRDSLKYKDEVDKHINTLTHILTNFKIKIYSPELLELDNKYSQYKACTLEFKNYLNYLIQTAKNKALDIKGFTNIYLLSQTLLEEENINFKKANNQRDYLIDKLEKMLSKKSLEELVLKTVEFKSERISQKDFYAHLTQKANLAGIELTEFPDFQKYIVYISMYNAIYKIKVMAEMDRLENEIKDALYQNDKQKELNKLSKNLALLKNIFNISLTKEDYKYYINNEQSFNVSNYISFINKETPLYKITAQLDKNITDLDLRRETISKFYEHSFKRDSIFIKNIKYSGRKKIAVVVTGGFHTENLCGALKKENIAYISIMPAFRNYDGYACPYFGLLAGNEAPLLQKLQPIFASVSSIQIASMLSSAIAPDVWGRANIDAFRAAVLVQEQIAIGRNVVNITRNGEDVVFQFENGSTEKMTIRALLDAVHQKDIDGQMERLSEDAFEDVENINKVLDEIKEFLKSIGATQVILDRVDSLKGKNADGRAFIRLVRGVTFRGHAGGQGIRLNATLKGNEQDVKAVIFHEIVAGLFGDHFLAERAEQAFRASHADSKLLTQASPLAMPIWNMTPEQRLNADRDFTAKRQWEAPKHAVYTVEQDETYDDIVIKELAKQRGLSVDNLEADFERTIAMLEARIRYGGFIQPDKDIIAQKMHEIFGYLIKVYKTQTQEPPGSFHVVDANTVNAFVIRKRTDVYFYKGLYEALYEISKRIDVPLTEDMIAFIIAHELSHALQNTSHLGLDIRDLNESVSPYLIQMIKNAEYDADMKALELMDKAGYSIFGAVDALTFFEFIKNSSQAENVLSSHPYVSLRKHRVSQIVFDQKTNIFTNVKAPRTPMIGAGLIKSQDVDFRYLMNKTERELQTMAQNAESVTALDELTGMFVMRKRMDALKALVNENYLKTSFLQHVYMQAVLGINTGPINTDGIIDTVDYEDMKQAAAIYDFGIQAPAKNILKAPKGIFLKSTDDIKTEIVASLDCFYTTTDAERTAIALLKSLLSSAKRKAKSLNYNDFDEFLLPPEKVNDLIPLFTKTKKLHGISISEFQKPHCPDQRQISNAISDPKRLISAFFYANYLGQEPSVEFGIPTTEIRVKLQRRKNELYLENPAYRDVHSIETRKKLQDIALLHYALAKTYSNVFSDNLDDSFPGIDKLLKVSPDTATKFFLKYSNLLSEKYPKPIAIQLSAKRIHDYFDVSQILNGSDTLQGFFDEIYSIRSEQYERDKLVSFINSHSLIIFIRDAIQKYTDYLSEENIKKVEEAIADLAGEAPFYTADERKISNVLTALTRIYSQEPQRDIEASDIFQSETKLNYYLKEREISSFKSLLTFPDWAVSDYLNREKDNVIALIEKAIRDDTPLSEIFVFMKTRLGYDDRRKVFENLFPKYYNEEFIPLLTFLKPFNNNPQEIIAWFLGMFSKEDALELIDQFCQNWLYETAMSIKNIDEAVEFKKLTLALLKYVYSQASKTFHANQDSVRIYLDLINDRIEQSGKADDEDYVRETVYNTLRVLSASTNLTIKLSYSAEMSQDGSPDFKTQKTSIIPPQFDGRFTQLESKFSLHNFDWNNKKSFKQSIFVTYLTDLSIDQLKELLKQRLRYIESQTDVEYRGEVFSLASLNDFFSNLITLIMLKKTNKPNWVNTKERISRLDDLMEISVAFHTDPDHTDTKNKIKVYSPDITFKKDNIEIAATPYKTVKENFVGTAIPSGELDPVWRTYVKANNLEGNFPEIAPLLQNPDTGNECIYNPITFLEKHKFTTKVSYRQIVKKFFMDSSVYSQLFNSYCELHGKGYVYGKYNPLEERLGWIEIVLPHKSIIKDSIIDLWEIDIFPEIIAALPSLAQLAQKASGEEKGLQDMWSLLGEMDDDVSRLKKLNDEIILSPERTCRLLTFYEAVIPLTLSPQKIARYGATSYMLWKQLPENKDLGLAEHLDILTKFMPNPSVLRDELLLNISDRYLIRLEDVPSISEKLYLNNLLSRNRDLRTEDFVSETLLHLFGIAKMEDRKDILLWIAGAQDKPRFVVEVENKYNIDFTTLPGDVKLLPSSIREKFIEGFMLGDNGVLDPQGDGDRHIMGLFLEQLFLYIFPEGTKGIDNEERMLISKIFLIVMKSFPPYRRVQVIKALAVLCARPDFEKISTGERLSVLLGVLGPVGIKVAQYLSENETLVPDDSMRSSLGALRHKAPEITKISVCAVLKNEVPLSEVLVQDIGGKPIGVASIKQVNRGKWLENEALAELVISKATRADADEVREKIHVYHAKEITASEAVMYILEKARQYKVDIEEAVIPVVFKVRRPNIETTINTDFAALDAVARDLEGTPHKGEALNISDLIQTVKEWIILEKHFENEAKFHNMLTELDYTWAENLEREAGVTIVHPRVLYATDSLIVEEEIQGVPVLNLAQKQQPITMKDIIDTGYSRAEADKVFNSLSSLEPRQAHIILSLKKAGVPERDLDGLSRKMLVYNYGKLRELLRHMLLHQIFIDGAFHADLHQGNVLITPEGKIAMIDRGNVGTLNKEQIQGAKIFLKGLLLRKKELIKHGIDLMFLRAQYPLGAQPVSSRITTDDIQEILDKGRDLKMTMNMVSVRAVQGAKNTPGGKDFSTFLKAFTQAMYLFPTDFSNSLATLQAIAQYISMSREEAQRAAQEQAKYFVVKDVLAETEGAQPQETDIVQIARRIFYKRTESYFMSSVWRPIIFRIITIPVKIALSKTSSIKSNMMTLVRVYGSQVIEEHIDKFAKMQDSEISDAVKDIITVQYAEKFLTDYVEHSMKKRFSGRLFAPVELPLFRAFLFIARPFTRIFTDAAKEWISGTVKQYIPQMTVREGVNFLSQIFGEDFTNIKKKFDEDRKKSPPEPPLPVSPAAQMKELGKRTPLESKKIAKKAESIKEQKIDAAAPIKITITDIKTKKDIETRRATNVESLQSDPMPGRVVRIVAGQAKSERDTRGHAIGDGRIYEKTAIGISKKMSDNRFSILEYDNTTGKTVLDKRKQVLTFDMESDSQYQKYTSDIDKAKARRKVMDAFIASIKNALQGLPQGGSIVAYVPQIAGGLQLINIENEKLIIAAEIQEAFHVELESRQLIMLPDAYSDLNPDNNQYPDYNARLALGRHITAYYRGDDTSLDRIKDQLQKLGENPDDILSIDKDGTLIFLRALRIKAIDYENIKQWQFSQAAIDISV